MKIGYLEVVEVKKIRSRSVCQLIVEADIGQFKDLVELDEQTGVFIPCEIKDAVCGAVDLDIDPDEIRQLMDLTATPAKTIEHEESSESSENSGPKEKSLAQKMMVAGYFRIANLWDAVEKAGIYTQDEHYEMVKGMKPINIYPNVRGEGDVVAHHCRTAENSGTGIKPPHWFCIPIYDSHHRVLHQHADRKQREDFLMKASEITGKAMKDKCKEFMGRESLSGITIAELEKFEKAIGYNRKFKIA